MYNRKSVELIVKPWKTLALSKYFWKLFPCKTTGGLLLLKNNEIHETWKLEFWENISRNNFALSDAEDNTLGSLYKWGIADLPLLGTLSAIRQKPGKLIFCKV